MRAGTLVQILGDFISLAEANGLILPDGAFVGPTDAQGITALAAGVESILKKHGVDVPAKVDAVVQMVPMFLALLK